MKKIWYFAALFFAVNWGAAAQWNTLQHDFSIGLSGGVLTGECEEIVYYDSQSDEMLSQLLWDVKGLWYLGADWKYSARQPDSNVSFFAEGGIKFSAPNQTGQMQDRDWNGQALTGEKDTTWLTNYSEHTNATTRDSVLFDQSVGAAFVVTDAITLKAYLTYTSMYFSFVATGGSILYTNYSSRELETLSEVAYSQSWHILELGFTFEGTFSDHFGVQLSFKISPYLIWVPTVDDHIMRALEVRDQLFGGLALEPILIFSFKQNSWLTWNLSVDYRYIGFVRGASTYSGHEFYDGYDHPTNVTIRNIAGAGYNGFDIGLNASLNIVDIFSRIFKKPE